MYMTSPERRKSGDRRQARAWDEDLHVRLKEKFDRVEAERRHHSRRQSDQAEPNAADTPDSSNANDSTGGQVERRSGNRSQ
jgi:hypothetical protein